MVDSQSPFAIARMLLQEYNEGNRTRESLLAALDSFDAQILEWGNGLERVPNSTKSYPEGEELIDASFEGLDCLAAAVQTLRDYAEQQDQELADQALEQISQAEELLTSLRDETAANVEHYSELLQEDEGRPLL